MPVFCQTHKCAVVTSADAITHGSPECVLYSKDQEYDISPINFDDKDEQSITDDMYNKSGDIHFLNTN